MATVFAMAEIGLLRDLDARQALHPVAGKLGEVPPAGHVAHPVAHGVARIPRLDHLALD
ncbi:hypothetical protein [Halomonas sp.]|uniref:hypothetical protein n=1 Tax=Halomonas sp. TaxID=1486246 RepID=UPI00298E09B4|nr:hypothetical protein [Halomonas sp.]MDW7745999.1 hypothetical protein [Halomonas sp.]